MVKQAASMLQLEHALTLPLLQNMEYKFVELMSCQFQASNEEYVRQQVTYRYNAVKSRLALMQARLADVNALVSCLLPTTRAHLSCGGLELSLVWQCSVLCILMHASCYHSVAVQIC